MNVATQRVTALIIAILLLAGHCCCDAAVAKEAVKRDHSCCASGKAAPDHRPSCACSTQVLAEAKAPDSAPAPLPGAPVVFHRELPPTVLRVEAGPCSRLRLPGCSPPAPAQRSSLCVWLI